MAEDCVETPIARSPGRPLDRELTDRLLRGAIDLLAAVGRRPFTAERLASAARAGKPAIFRRWPDLDALFADALLAHPVQVAAPLTGSLEGDLAALLEQWCTPLQVEEGALAALLGTERLPATPLAAAIDYSVRRPVHAVVASLRLRHAEWDARTAAHGGRLLQGALGALYAQRLLTGGLTGPLRCRRDRQLLAGVLAH
ncbi:TetR family transcriptional regulator [Geodermatophilus nigrescens]